MTTSASQPPSYNLGAFSLAEMTRCGMELRRIGAGASSMEEVGERTVRYLFERLVAPGGSEPACALVRLFVTMPFHELQDEQQEFAAAVLGARPGDPNMKCLTLLASAGVEEPWNSRHRSAGHKALPLASEASVARSPMIAQLIRQLGVEVSSLLASDSRLMVEMEQHSFNVFYVPDAEGSPFIPAQGEFVIPHGIRSVLGFGGVLPSGELFAMILFSRVRIPREIAELFKTLSLNVKVALLPFVDRRVFA
jgi:hypothetical protein